MKRKATKVILRDCLESLHYIGILIYNNILIYILFHQHRISAFLRYYNITESLHSLGIPAYMEDFEKIMDEDGRG
ncbi:MAG: hypothetical protein COV36_05550 [Alphaproteobacteria bacterium CG11_big_fil_rev_8_21_14_0_20_44_7]|nr:MAG: hypothetical protein COV36_05550 [Alphaproteobacteria bacterium CG11_big_fil_rev_8_21_14_0_20_44_7]